MVPAEVGLARTKESLLGLGWCGGVAQLGERSVRNAEVGGSIPLTSTNFGDFAVFAMRARRDGMFLGRKSEE